MSIKTFRDFRKQFVQYINDHYSPRRVYYPACGADSLPKEVFGDHRVVHLSLPEHKKEFNYFALLGEGIKVYGDMDHSPFAENVFDMIWLKLDGILPSASAVNGFKSSLCNGGYIVIEEYHRYERQSWDELLTRFPEFRRIQTTSSHSRSSLFASYHAKDYNNLSAYEEACVLYRSEQAMIDFVASHKDFSGIEFVVDRAILKKGD